MVSLSPLLPTLKMILSGQMVRSAGAAAKELCDALWLFVFNRENLKLTTERNATIFPLTVDFVIFFSAHPISRKRRRER